MTPLQNAAIAMRNAKPGDAETILPPEAAPNLGPPTDKEIAQARAAVMGFYSIVNPTETAESIENRIDKIDFMAGKQWSDIQEQEMKEQTSADDS